MTILITGGPGATVGSGLPAAGCTAAAWTCARPAGTPSSSSWPAGVPVHRARFSPPPTRSAPRWAGVTDLFLYAEPAGHRRAGWPPRPPPGVEAGRAGCPPARSPSRTPVHETAGPPTTSRWKRAACSPRRWPRRCCGPGAFASNALGWSHAIRAGGPPWSRAYPERPRHRADPPPRTIVDVAELALARAQAGRPGPSR